MVRAVDVIPNATGNYWRFLSWKVMRLDWCFKWSLWCSVENRVWKEERSMRRCQETKQRHLQRFGWAMAGSRLLEVPGSEQRRHLHILLTVAERVRFLEPQSSALDTSLNLWFMTLKPDSQAVVRSKSDEKHSAESPTSAVLDKWCSWSAIPKSKTTENWGLFCFHLFGFW